MEIIFLGTSSMTPTSDRAQSTVLIRQSGEHLLFDCGENTQRQMRIAGLAVPKIKQLFLSHWHGDHVIGLPGLLENIGKWGAEKALNVYGPKGSAKKMKAVMDAFGITGKVKVTVKEVSKNGVVYKGRDFVVRAMRLKHSIPSVGYAVIERDRRRVQFEKAKALGLPEGPILRKLQEGKDIVFEGKNIKAKDVTTIVKGKKVVYITDTVACAAAVTLAKGVDVLIIESTFADAEQTLAKAHYHLTSTDAGKIAKKAGVKKLVLTHFSQRYPMTEQLRKEAEKVFSGDVLCASDFLTLTV